MTWRFQTLAGKPDMVNEYANRLFITEPEIQFSTVFPNFFGILSANMKSWIDIFSNHFEIDKVKNDALHKWRKSKEGDSVKKTVDEMFTQLLERAEDQEQAYHYEDEQKYLETEQKVQRIKQLYICLFYVYKLLMNQDYNRNDAPFNFMNGFLVHDTRVVILGNEPADVDSSGYAFHGSFCESTMELLLLINSDMEVLSKYCHNDLFKMTEDEFEEAQCQYSLQGLINQGVLFMNVKFTPADKHDELEGALEIFTDFLLEYLSKQPTPNVFILAGNVSAKKEHLIDQTVNLCMKVYHPSFYSYGCEPNPKLDWNSNIPLINANFFIFQTIGSQHMIDWSDMSGIKPGKRNRLVSLARVFGAISPNSNPFAEYSICKAAGSSRLYLLKSNTEVTHSLPRFV
ncbi:unnamed protein product [Orchesella dallaii]|uniref:Uracil-DNA glycosylase-like domain-containing protein n=1 Tax=Orchesella dallaii TaxID=48710 RepID=A0ABP1PMB4_9HEXA